MLGYVSRMCWLQFTVVIKLLVHLTKRDAEGNDTDFILRLLPTFAGDILFSKIVFLKTRRLSLFFPALIIASSDE